MLPIFRLSAGWLMPLFSFTTSMWIGVGLIFVFSVFYLWYLEWMWKRSSRVVDSLFSVLSIFLEQSSSHFRVKKGLFINIFISSLLVLSLFVSAFYSSGLASIMTIPRLGNNSLCKTLNLWS